MGNYWKYYWFQLYIYWKHKKVITALNNFHCNLQTLISHFLFVEVCFPLYTAIHHLCICRIFIFSYRFSGWLTVDSIASVLIVLEGFADMLWMFPFSKTRMLTAIFVHGVCWEFCIEEETPHLSCNTLSFLKATLYVIFLSYSVSLLTTYNNTSHLHDIFRFSKCVTYTILSFLQQPFEVGYIADRGLKLRDSNLLKATWWVHNIAKN